MTPIVRPFAGCRAWAFMIAGWVMCAVAAPGAAQSMPVVVIECTLDDLPPDFDPVGFDVPNRLRPALESEVATLLRGAFPFIEWVTHSDRSPGPVANEAARLTVALKGEMRATWRIFLAFSASFPAGAVPIATPAANLYEDGESLPIPKHIERVTLDRARIALKTLIGSNLREWEGNLTSRIRWASDLRLARDVFDPNAHEDWLVVPIAAQASMADTSVLEASFDTIFPDNRRTRSKLSLKPVGPVFDGPLVGMQQCYVRQFELGSQTHQQWHPHIPLAVDKRLKPTVNVRVVHYEREFNPIAPNP